MQVDFELFNTQIASDNAELSNSHHASGNYADEHEEHEPEQFCVQRFFQCVIASCLYQFARYTDFTFSWRTQEPCSDESQATLQDTEEQEGFLETRRFDHCC